jgi:hypothetical protein
MAHGVSKGRRLASSRRPTMCRELGEPPHLQQRLRLLACEEPQHTLPEGGVSEWTQL